MTSPLPNSKPQDKSARAAILDELAQIIAARAQDNDAQNSWTAQLLARGLPAVTQKFGEEAVEVIIAAQESPEKLIEESADVLYHLLVLWQAAGVSSDDVWRCLAERRATSGIEEKKKR